MLVQEGDGKRGGFAVFWRRGIDVALRNISRYHIDMDVKEEDGFSWRFTGVYGEPSTEHKYKTWEDLKGM
jgi:hypothetical protein